MMNCKRIIAWLLLATLLVMSLASCGKEEPIYTVEYMVDGALYETKSVYSTELLDLPDTPHKDGYTFLGWFWDDGVFTEAFTAETLKKKPVGTTQKAYAAWAEGSNTRLSAPSNVAINGEILSWSAVVGASSYEVLLNEVSYTTDKTSFDLTGKITAQGSYLVYVRALSSNESVAASSWSESAVYVVGAANPIGTHAAFKHGIGYGYNIVENPYYDTYLTKSVSPFELSKLEQYIGELAKAESYQKFVKGETIADYMDAYSVSIGVATGAEGQYQCFSASAETSFNVGFSSRKEGHNYQAFCTYLINADQKAYVVQNCTLDIYHSLLSNEFKRALTRESMVTKGMSDGELATFLIQNYGTHIVTGVYLGGRIESSYYVSSSSQSELQSIVTELEAATSGGVEGIAQAHASVSNKNDINSESSYKNSSVTSQITVYGGDGAKIQALESGRFEPSALSEWADSLNEKPAAVSLANNGLLPLYTLIPEGEEFDGVRDALISLFKQNASSKYDSVLAKYALKGSTEKVFTVDLSQYYSAGEGPYDMLSGEYVHDLFDEETGVFTLKGAIDGEKYSKYVFKGLYNAKNGDGDTCKTMLKNFAIRIDAEDDIEIVLENISFTAPNGHSALFLNPEKADEQANVKVTLTINGESRLIGANGADATESGENGSDGYAAIDFSISDNAELIVAGDGTLTTIGGDGGDGYSGENGTTQTKSGENGTNGGDGAIAIITPSFVKKTSSNCTVSAHGGNGGNGGDGGNGIGGYVSDNGGYNGGAGGNGGNGGNGGSSLSALLETPMQYDFLSTEAGNGGNGGAGGNGGDGGRSHPTLGWWTKVSGFNGGNAGKGGNGGNGGDDVSAPGQGGTLGLAGKAGAKGDVKYGLGFTGIEASHAGQPATDGAAGHDGQLLG